MGKRNYSMHVALILGLAVLIPQCVSEAPSWTLPPAFQQSPFLPSGHLPIDCKALASDPHIPQFLIDELCSQPQVETTTQSVVENKDQEEAEEDAAKEEVGAKEPLAAKPSSSDDAQDPSKVLVPFFRTATQKLVSTDGKLTPREFWSEVYQDAGAPKLSRRPSFFELVAGLRQAVESFRTEDSWWRVVRRLKDLTSDKQWERLEAALAAAHAGQPGNHWKVLGASRALKVALKTSIEEPECRVEGLNPDPDDCREFLICYRSQGRWKSKDKKCPKYTEFSPSRLRCVWAPLSDCVEQPDSDSDSDSDEDSGSDESSREILERILKHGPGAFYV